MNEQIYCTNCGNGDFGLEVVHKDSSLVVGAKGRRLELYCKRCGETAKTIVDEEE
jgi:uncharacterized Zn finger protein